MLCAVIDGQNPNVVISKHKINIQIGTDLQVRRTWEELNGNISRIRNVGQNEKLTVNSECW